jgi:hypothetical protein
MEIHYFVIAIERMTVFSVDALVQNSPTGDVYFDALDAFSLEVLDPSASSQKTGRVRTLVEERLSLSVLASWPSDGRTRRFHYDFEVSTSRVMLTLRQADYQVFRRILEHNIGASPRIFPESKSFQGLLGMVVYNYDRPEGPQTGYRFKIEIDKVSLLLDSNNDEPVVELICGGLSYELR